MNLLEMKETVYAALAKVTPIDHTPKFSTSADSGVVDATPKPAPGTDLQDQVWLRVESLRRAVQSAAFSLFLHASPCIARVVPPPHPHLQFPFSLACKQLH